MIKEVVDNRLCCGCEACSAVCPQAAINMILDDEGFLRPNINDNCIECKLCQKVCPIKNDFKPMTLMSDREALYAASKKLKVTSSCSSGGIAYEISYQFISSGGIVYGAAYSDDFSCVIVKRIKDVDKLDCLKGAKYVQTIKGNIYKEIRDDLEKGHSVLYIALPCEIAALKSFLKRDYESLLTIDLICHGPTSVFGLRDYINGKREKNNSSIVELNMRYKKSANWTPYYFRIAFQDGFCDEEPFWQSDFGFLFARFARPSCYHCKFKGDFYLSDITIGDAWGAPEHIVETNKSGLSMVILNTSKGKKLFSNLKNTKTYHTTVKMLTEGNPNLLFPRKIEGERYSISCMLKKAGLKKTVRKNKKISRRFFDMLRAIKHFLR